MTFAPSDLTGLRLWLRAKDLGSGGSSVTTWTDQSGQANNATAPGTAPVVAASSTPSSGKSVAFTGQALNLTRSPSLNALISSATASSEPAGSSFNAAKAIDGDHTGTRWLGSDSTGGSPQWLRLNMTAATVLTYYKIWGHPSSTSYNPTDWKFQGTNDGTFATWTDLDTRSGITWSSTSDTKEFTFSNSTAYAYYRILITGNVSATDFTCISEIIVQPEADVAELWVVVKANSTTGATNSWQFGNSGQSTIYPWNTGQVIDNFGVTTHSDLWTPTLAVNSWRLYRVKINAGTMDIWLDNTSQKNKTGLTSGWDATPQVSVDFSGNIAEMAVVFGTELTSGNVADMIAYFNSEHGLTVSGGTVTVTGAIAASLPSLTASAAGTVTDQGSIAATLPALTANIIADNTKYAVVAATLPSLTASASGLVTIAGSVAATLPSLTASITGTDPVPANIIEATLPSLTAAISGTSTPDVVEISMDLHGGGTLDIDDLIKVNVTSMQMRGAGRVNLRLPRDWDADPRTLRPQWKFVLADMPTLGGALKCQLEVVSDGIEESLDEVTSGAFSIRTRDPKRDLIEPVTTWLHVYRGSHHMGGGPILPEPRDDGATTTYQWRDPRWLLDGDFRPIKQIPRRGLLRNPEFDQGLLYWTGGFDPGTIPAAKPIVSIVDSEFEPGGKALEIRGADKTQLVTQEAKTGAVFVPNSATYLPGGAAVIQAIGANIPNGSTVQITGHTADDNSGSGLTLSHNRALAAKATLSAMGKSFTFVQPSTSSYAPGTFVTGGSVVGRGFYSPVASNSTEAGQAQNRRVVIAYEGTQTALGSAQWESQTTRVTAVPQRKTRISPVGEFKITEWIGPNLPGLAAKVTVVKVGETVPIDSGTAEVEMTEDTPRDRLVSTSELEGNLEVEIPAGTAQYDVTLYLYAPAGAIHWEWADIYPDDGLFFYGVDQALIVKGLVDHAQSTAMGWAPLGFSTRTPLTGVSRKREYYYSMQRPTSVALTEFTALDRGLNISCEVAPSGATLVTHYPRQGTTSDLVLAHGYNVIGWEPASSRDVASLIIAQADGNGIARPEKYAIDDTALGGLRLGGIVNAENETPLNELDELAVRELARAKITTPAYWVTIHPRHVSDFYDRAGMGDSLRLSTPVFDGAVRLVKRQPDPNTDGCRAMLAVEV